MFSSYYIEELWDILSIPLVLRPLLEWCLKIQKSKRISLGNQKPLGIQMV